jgi:hypothetical protein
MRTTEFRKLSGTRVGKRNRLFALSLGLSSFLACDTGSGISRSGGTSLATGGNRAATGGNTELVAPAGTGGAVVIPAVGVGSRGTDHCVLNTDQTVSCWSDDWMLSASNTVYLASSHLVSSPKGPFSSISVGGDLSGCGVRTDGTLGCWGGNPVTLPTGIFKSVGVGTGSGPGCALRTDGTIACWSKSYPPPGDPPAGTFTSISFGPGPTCGVRTNGTVVCWQFSGALKAVSLEGTFTSISVGSPHICGIRSDGTLACAMYEGSGCSVNGVDDCLAQDIIPPSGTFTMVSVGRYLACGIRTEGTLACWPNWYPEVPTGTFTFVSVGSDAGGCGVRTDGSVVCWPLPHR